MGKYSKDKKGFTIIELLVATAVFSVVLIVFVSAFVRIGELFYKGINLANTQEAARNMVQNISNDIQFYGVQPQLHLAQGYFCVGGHRYSYVVTKQYTPGSPTDYGMVKEIHNCVAPIGPDTPNFNTAEELIDPGMQINAFNLDCSGVFGQCIVSTHIVFYASDPTVLLPSATDPKAQCSGAINSSQYCATADYSSTILQNL